MPETNKILEVTYGEFSCRLEGFDDAVETMKAVVAYFHELSGHEDFMNIRPQAPDAATLALLTQEQNGGTVEVENTDQGISLRVRPEEDSFAEDAAVIDDRTDDAAEDVADEDPTLDEVGSEEDHAEAATSFADVAEEENTQFEDDHLSGETSDAAHIDEMTASDDDDAGDIEEPAEIDEATDEDVVVDIFGEAEVNEDDQSQHTAEVSETDDTTETETSVADKLERIRAVVGRGTPPSDDSYAEDVSEFETDAAPKAANPLAQRLAELAKRKSEPVDTDIADDAGDIGQSETPETDDMSATEEDTFEASQEPLEEESIGSEDAIAEAAEANEAETIAAFSENDEHDVEDNDLYAIEEENVAEMTDEDASEPVEAAADEAVEAAADEVAYDDPIAEEEPETGTSENAETDAFQFAESDAETKAEKPATRPLLLTSPTQVSDDDSDDDEDDDDFDLHAEVAEIEREIAARPGNEVARHGLPRSVEDAMSRILNETNEHLNEPESKRHRDAFAQLKAAVAATEASRVLGDNTNKSRDIGEVFRDDLGALDAEGKEKGEGLPPLKLVTPIADDPMMEPAAARHDEPVEAEKPLDAATERLRAIAAKVASRDASMDMTFAKFAEQQGARELADLLEAAAAYIAYVDGETDFSRPQVMKVVQSASEEEISREDGLRSFGRLLRQSRIIKLNNGRFQVSEDTRFRPDTDQAARG